jgi:threonine aldolase
MSDQATGGGSGAATGAARAFASDNHAGAHPDVLAAIEAANRGHAPSYGADRLTAAARESFRRHFGPDADAYLVFNGSGANVACLDAVTRSYEGVICAESAHMNVDECGAPERIAGAKLLTVATEHGKLSPDDLGRWEARRGDEHFAQPRLVSISQATELGTVYTAEETAAIAAAAHGLGMLLHVDGARLANAAASLDTSLAALTTEAGVDLLSFGGTKNGLLLGDAVVFLRPGLGEGFEFVRKQLGQLASKMRFVAAQFDALLAGDLWRRCAAHANAMARRLADAVAGIDGVEIVHPVEANAVFARLPRPAIDRLLAEWPYERPFYVWDESADVVRWMCAWDTDRADVDAFAAEVARAIE